MGFLLIFEIIQSCEGVSRLLKKLPDGTGAEEKSTQFSARKRARSGSDNGDNRGKSSQRFFSDSENHT